MQWKSYLSSLLVGLVLVGCASEQLASTPVVDTREVEELDLFRLDGDRLYVYSRAGILSVVDVTDAKAPSAIAALPVDGRAGELFVEGGDVILVVEERTIGCNELPDYYGYRQESEVAAVLFRDGVLEMGERFCLPGTVVGSRVVGSILYVVTSDWEETRVLSFDVSQPAAITLVDAVPLSGTAHELHVTTEALFIAQQTEVHDDYDYRWDMTRLTYIDIDDPNGNMYLRGSIVLEGAPQGRFHLDAAETTFRIVTFDERMRASTLHIVDTTDPMALTLLGTSPAIGSGEQLYATRFVGDRAYVVTFRQTDPLWVLDLTDPTTPRIMGELVVPGWSDFIFPRGDTLITVGRGDRGAGVALAAFDVSDPENPSVIDRIEVGDWGATSEANEDHRGLRIYEPGEIADTTGPVVALPTRWEDYAEGDWTCTSYLQLVEYDDRRFVLRGGIDQTGAIRRTLAVDGELVSISDIGLLSIDVRDLDQPNVSTELNFEGTENRGCYYYHDQMYYDGIHEGGGFPFMFNCSAQGGAPGVSILAALGLLALLRRRR